ncbi:hypothetical protein IMZ29_09830 [Achromobacter sp. GG226]|uniref:hypothetical protein n=1 Tax=Verticiella alkaliphila TaxID=2779529 RepID=UPI001C0BCF89|nr:hypothetical protein [Verticiella sp. GG226]MBU4610818.1 hypothetical protein [Verticiella sp. GG226]
MILLLPNALPPAGVATELARRLPAAAPTLAAWLASAIPRMQAVPLADVGCTADQAWRLQHAGYRPPADAPLGAGWPLLTGEVAAPDPHAPVWLADIAHLRVTQQGVTLFDPAELALTPAHAEALLATALPLLAEIGIHGEPISTGRVRIHLPDGVTPYAPTPAAVGGTDIQDLWPQGAAARPWRRALNLVQMAWHDHPVNDERQAAGLVPVNGLWLFGGGRAADVASPESQAPLTVDDSLDTPARRGDFAAWLEALARLETERLAPLQAALARGEPERLILVLTGDERIATLDVTPPRGLRRWLPTRRQDWQAWWAPRPASRNQES